MDKKWIGVVIILFVSLLALGSVSAADLVDRDFDSYFSMKVPKGVSFQENINDSTRDGINNVSAEYISEHYVLFYTDSVLMSENSSAFFYQTFFESMNLGSTKCYETQEGDLTILEPIGNSNLNFPIVGKSSGHKLLILTGDEDINTLKEMGRSIEFK